MSASSRHRDTRCHRVRAALRLALGVSVLAAVAASVVGCGDPQQPVAENIEDLTVEVGSTEPVDLAAHFSDPDGDELMYGASSSNTSIATVSVSGATAQVTAVAAGNATVTVTVTSVVPRVTPPTVTVLPDTDAVATPASDVVAV